MAEGQEVFETYNGFTIRVLVIPEYSPHPPNIPFGYNGYVARPGADLRIAGQAIRFQHPLATFCSVEAAERAGFAEGRSIVDGAHPEGLTVQGL